MSRREFVSRSEAKARGLKRYYDGVPCRKAKHDSDRFTVNGGCAECTTIRTNARYGKQTPAGDAARARAAALDEPAPPVASILKYQSAPAVATDGPFTWTAENKAKLIDMYVDTGDIALARDSIGVRPSEYRREVERNEAFARAIAAAEPKAQKHLEERAIQLALRGNDKLLIAVLKARLPEYRDSLKIEQTHLVKLSDQELDRRIRQLGGPVIEANFTEVEPQRQIGTSSTVGREEAARESEQDIHPLLQ